MSPKTAEPVLSHLCHHEFCAPDTEEEQAPLKGLNFWSRDIYRIKRWHFHQVHFNSHCIFYSLVLFFISFFKSPLKPFGAYIIVFGLRTVLCQIWGPSPRLIKKKREYPNKQNKKWKRRCNSRYHRNKLKKKTIR